MNEEWKNELRKKEKNNEDWRLVNQRARESEREEVTVFAGKNERKNNEKDIKLNPREKTEA